MLHSSRSGACRPWGGETDPCPCAVSVLVCSILTIMFLTHAYHPSIHNHLWFSISENHFKTRAYELIILCDQHLKQMLLSNERLLFMKPNFVVLLLSGCFARLLRFKLKFQIKYKFENQFQNQYKTSAMSLFILFYSK